MTTLPAIRFDSGAIARYEMDGDTLRCWFRFRKIGDLQYYDRATGKIRTETVTADELYKRKSLRTASLKPITLNHPDAGMVTRANARQYQRGMTGSTILRDDPYAVIVGAVTDEELMDSIQSDKTTEVSSGYWSTLTEDGCQSDVKYNHFAAVEAGRAGPDVGFLGFSSDALDTMPNQDIAIQVLDADDLRELFNKPIIWTPYDFQSSKTDSEAPSMTKLKTTIRIDDSRSVEVGDSEGEQAIAGFLRESLDSNAALAKKLADYTATVDSLTVDLTQARAETVAEKTRADLAQKQLDEKPGDDAIATAKKDGYERRLLEESAEKVLPAEIKIDSALSDRQIKEAVVLHKLGYKADSAQAKPYLDMNDLEIGVAYKMVLDAGVASAIPAASVTPANQQPAERADADMVARQKMIDRMKGKKPDC
jgi:hypothetical protein